MEFLWITSWFKGYSFKHFWITNHPRFFKVLSLQTFPAPTPGGVEYNGFMTVWFHELVVLLFNNFCNKDCPSHPWNFHPRNWQKFPPNGKKKLEKFKAAILWSWLWLWWEFRCCLGFGGTPPFFMYIYVYIYIYIYQLCINLNSPALCNRTALAPKNRERWSLRVPVT